VASVIAGMKKHFLFHIRWISILKFLYFNFFRTPYVLHSNMILLLRLSVSKFYLSCIIIIIIIIITSSYKVLVHEPHYTVLSETFIWNLWSCTFKVFLKVRPVPRMSVFFFIHAGVSTRGVI
jgi:hypothetical protein